MSASWMRLFGLMITSSWLFVGCSSAKGIDVGGACILNSDCNTALVCTAGKCHDACHISADCPLGQSCIIAVDQSTVCQLPIETKCADNGDCKTPLTCAADLRCRNQCQRDADCLTGQVCATTGTCAEPNQVDSTRNLFAPDGGVSGCQVGTETCSCYPNDTCNAGLTCASQLCVNLGTGGSDDAGGCPVGAETCSCYANDTCNAGLTCASHLCVSLGAGGSGGGDAGVPDALSSRPDAPARGTDGGSGGVAGVGGTMGTGGAATGGTTTRGGTSATGGTLASGMTSTGGTTSAGTTGTGGTLGLDNGLVAYYPFNGSANDETSYANNGTVVGATLTTDRFGNPAAAYQFDGADNYIEVPDAPQQHVTAVTLAAWARLDSFTSARAGGFPGEYIVFKRNTRTSNFEGYTLQFYGPPMNPAAMATSASGLQVGGGLAVDSMSNWNYLVMTADSSALKFFMNGQLAATSATGFPVDVGTRPLFIGRSGEWCEGYLNGAVDDIRIYNRVLTPAEVLQLYTREQLDGGT